MLTEGALLSVGTPLPKGVTIGKVVEACARAGRLDAWQEGLAAPEPARPSVSRAEPHLRRGSGSPAPSRTSASPSARPSNATATIELHGKAEIERGRPAPRRRRRRPGAHTVMVQMAAEAVGVPVDKIRADRLGHRSDRQLRLRLGLAA